MPIFTRHGQEGSFDMDDTNKELSLDNFMLQLGFHRHKQNYRGKGLYYEVGGYDLTKQQAQRIQKVFTQQLNTAVLEARNNALLDLERWIKLHDLDQEMILDGIEHMVISNLQVPDQPRLDNSERIATLKQQLKDKGIK